MDAELRRLIREHYPFPIAHAHKKTLACLDDDAHKLKCLIQAAEATVQFLALVMLAQLHHDLAHQQAPALGQRGLQLRDDLRNPSFGKWHGLLRDLLKQYHAHPQLLVMPELFEVYFQPGRGSRLVQQPVVQQAIEPLITLRNQFHHPGIPDALIPAKVAMGTHGLEQLLEGLQFLRAYPLAFVQRIEVRHDGAAVPRYHHDLVQMQGCFSIFERQRWESDVPLREGHLVLLTFTATGRNLFLAPFLACAEELPVPGVFDIFLLNGTEQRRARFLPAQGGQELESAGQALPAVEAERAGASTEDVFRARYQPTAAAKRPVSPYKFLDWFEPEDAALFFGRDQEIQRLQRKFHAARLLILHGESGTGKTSLIRAGLLPRLEPEHYVPVYVRALHEPAWAIKEAMVRQLGVDQRHLDRPLAQFLDAETAHLSKAVVVILDQFEEFFLRLPLEVRRLFHQELGACVAAAHLDVHFIIALRDDYFSSLAEFQDAIPDLFTHEMRLAHFTHAQALAAAVEPVKRVGWSIDEALVAEVILPHLDEPEKGIEPPLLQIVCDALYQQAQDAGRTRIGAEEYVALGDVRQALGRYLNTTLRQFGQQQPQARAVLKALVTAEGTKRASFVDEIVARLHSTGLVLTAETAERDFLRKLVQARLVRVEDVEGRPRYELTHEFLVQQIGTWIAESERELTKVLELIDRAYEAYRATGLLLEPEALALITPFQDELVVPVAKQRFLDLSRQTARRRRRGLWLRVGVLLLLVGLGVGSAFSWQLYRAYQQSQRRLATLYVEQGRQELRDGQDLRALAYLSEAYRLGATGLLPRFLLARARRALDAQLTVLQSHSGSVEDPSFSPDGTRVVTRSWDGARVWDAATGTLLTTLQDESGWVKAASFSPDGMRVLTVSGETARVWEVASGRQLTVLQGHSGQVEAASFSPDGARVVTASTYGPARVWDAATGALLTTLQGYSGWAKAASFSPDGTRVMTVSSGTVRLWDATTGTLLTTLQGYSGSVKAVSFSPDGMRVLTVSGETARMWEVASGRQFTLLQGHSGWVEAASFSPDGTRVVTASIYGPAQVWDTATGTLLATLQGDSGGGGTAAGFSPDGTRVMTVGSGTVRLWDATTGTLLTTLQGHSGWAEAASFSPDGRRVMIVSRGTVRLWDATTGTLLTTLQGHSGRAAAASFSPDGTRVMTLSDETAQVWDAATGTLLTVLQGHSGSVRAANFSPDGTRVVTVGDMTAQVWDAATGTLLINIQDDSDAPAVSLSPDGTQVVIRGLEGTAQVEAASFSSDGTRVVTRSRGGTMRVWDAATGTLLATLQTYRGGGGIAVSLSPDGTRVVTGNLDGTARVWEVASGRQLTVLQGHSGQVEAASFSPDGTRVVTGSTDGIARVWEAATGTLLTVLQGHSGSVRAASFSPDGTRVVTASADGTARVWEVALETRSPAEVVALVQHRGLWHLNAEGQLLRAAPDPQ